ncbi:MAG: hypothetical protein HY064_06595 [Bacteroidetes bacterium]|nr:hypothetical protein [Bacteroidota bacterium]
MQNSVACSCSGPSYFSKSEFDGQKYIFIGKCISFTEIDREKSESHDSHLAKFVAYKIYKGVPDSDATFSVTCAPEDPCGSSFSPGEYYFICTYGSSYLCDRCRPIGIYEKDAHLKKKLKTYVENFQYDALLDEMAAYEKKHGSLYAYYGSKQNFVNGKLEGRIDFYYDEISFSVDPDTVKTPRTIYESDFYHNGNLDSMYMFSEDGKTLKEISRYRNNAESGWQDDYLNGHIRSRDYYDSTGKRKISLQYENNGSLFYRTEFNDSVTSYYNYEGPGGSLQQLRKRYNDGSGSIQLFRSDSSVYMQGDIRIEHSPVRWNEEILYVNEYINTRGEHVVTKGKGHLTEWYNDSIKEFEADVSDGIFYGHVCEWYDDGHLHSEGFYKPPGDSNTYHNSMIDALSESDYNKFGFPYDSLRVLYRDGTLEYEFIYHPDHKTFTNKYFENGEWKEIEETVFSTWK